MWWSSGPSRRGIPARSDRPCGICSAPFQQSWKGPRRSRRLVILDARDGERGPLATAWLDHHVPWGFHVTVTRRVATPGSPTPAPDRLGGVWRDNTYPGAAFDVLSYVYSYSFEPNGWSRPFAPQPEILAYRERCATEYFLTQHLRFSTEIVDATFDTESRCRRLRTADSEAVEADVLVSACGQLSVPAYPNIAGLKQFGGTVYPTVARPDVDVVTSPSPAAPPAVVECRRSAPPNRCSSKPTVPAVVAYSWKFVVSEVSRVRPARAGPPVPLSAGRPPRPARSPPRPRPTGTARTPGSSPRSR